MRVPNLSKNIFSFIGINIGNLCPNYHELQTY
jgi:hypothetical protein